MHDRGKVLFGIAVFLILVLFPIWFTAAFGKTGAAPDPVIEPDTKPCVESAAFMRVHHMEILDTWRNQVVREGLREWKTPDGRTFDMSLTKTCMNCHRDKARFCDRCHDYADVKPYCFDCHLERKGD